MANSVRTLDEELRIDLWQEVQADQLGVQASNDSHDEPRDDEACNGADGTHTGILDGWNQLTECIWPKDLLCVQAKMTPEQVRGTEC